MSKKTFQCANCRKSFHTDNGANIHSDKYSHDVYLTRVRKHKPALIPGRWGRYYTAITGKLRAVHYLKPKAYIKAIAFSTVLNKIP